MSIVLSVNFWAYLFWITPAPHRRDGLAHIISGVLDMPLYFNNLRNQETPASLPSLIWELSCPNFGFRSFFFFLNFTCTFPFTHTCPHRASGINLVELKIINPVVEEVATLTCAAHFLTPSVRCILRVRGLPRRVIFITTPPCISFACVCQGASGESSNQITFFNKSV